MRLNTVVAVLNKRLEELSITQQDAVNQIRFFDEEIKGQCELLSTTEEEASEIHLALAALEALYPQPVEIDYDDIPF